uniref:non-specific serine/threonine protein kinase n=1 Tax=Pithovirus LCPAC401 TaxID=2506595 RepID=A0A481ZAL3_9VIRU|nr:MAG: putative serine/threonine protein kinase [Pithovirus LCPAC401]
MTKIGEGTYSTVYVDNDDDNYVIKVYKRGDDNIKNIVRELACLTSMRHKAILPINHQNISNANDTFIVKIKKLEKIEFLIPDSLNIFISHISSALAYSHNIGIIHNDIKINNIMFDSVTGWYVLIDWGSARILTSKYNFCTYMTTPQFRPPEWLRKEEDIKIDYEGKSDIWALAITAIMLIDSLTNLLYIESENDILEYLENEIGRDREVRKRNLSILTYYSLDDCILEILVDMLDFDPKTRIAASEIVQKLGINPLEDTYIDPGVKLIIETNKSKRIFKEMSNWIKKTAKNLQITPSCVFTSLTLAMKVSERFIVTNNIFELICSTCINISAYIYYDDYTDKVLSDYSEQFSEDDLRDCRNIVLENIKFNVLP